MSPHTIGLIAGIISLYAYLLYIYRIWWGNTRPSRSSWWMLTVAWSVLFLSSLSLGDQSGNIIDLYFDRAIQISYITGSLVIAISTIWRGQREPWKLLDTACVALTVLALVFYFIFSTPLWSLLMAILADFFAVFPTIENARLYPANEDKTAWTIELIASIISLGTVAVWTVTYMSISLWLPVLYLVVINGIIVFFVWSGRKKITTPAVQ